MGTVIDLDVARKVYTEPPFTYSRRSRDLPQAQRGKNLVYKWRTGVWTLQPINLTTDFTETNHWETLKERASTVTFGDSRFWTEYPKNHRNGVKWDYFFVTQVPAAEAPDPSTNGYLLAAMVDDIGQIAIADVLNYMQRHSLAVAYSNTVYPANQGYKLRFAFLGDPSQARGRILDFWFGDFCIGLDANGAAHLYRHNGDYQKYAQLTMFKWTSHIEGDHEITIFPHNQNCIEFITSNSFTADQEEYPDWDSVVNKQVTSETTPVVLPDDRGVVPATGDPLITAAGPWFLAVSVEFQMEIQVSRLAFYNGTGGPPASLYDEPVPFGYGPQVQPTVQPFGYLHGGASSCNLYDSSGSSFQIDTAVPFVADGNRSACQFGITLTGKKDIADIGGVASSTTPEFFGYVIEKGSLSKSDGGGPPATFPIIRHQLDYGGKPEQESMTVLMDNSLGALNDYIDRKDMGVVLRDDATGVVFFEGTCHEIISGLAPAWEAQTCELHCIGMADSLLWSYPIDLDFTQNPHLLTGEAWKWQDAIKRCFEVGDITPDDVVFEDYFGNDGTPYNFALWHENSGQPTSSQQFPSSVANQRWRPKPDVPVYQFIDFLASQTFGWHWYRDRKRSKWVFYKRPRPGESAGKPAVAKFFSTREAAEAAGGINGDPPCYTHSHWRKRTKRAKATTIVGVGYMRGPMMDEGQMQRIIGNDNISAQDLAAPIMTQGMKLYRHTYDNINAYQNANNPHPDRTHPDFRRTQVVRVANLVQAPSKEAFQFLLQRVYEDHCHSYTGGEFEADWGDETTAYFRKWDPIEIDGVRYLIDRIEPTPEHDLNRRARYTVWLERDDAPPPW